MRTAQPSPRIVVDVHERTSRIAEMLADLGAEVQVSSLRIGDYAVGGGALVERKRVLHLHSAIVDGSFWPQIGQLRANSSIPYLIIEGAHGDRGPLKPESIRGACVAVMDLGVRLIRTDNQRDSAAWIFRLALRRQRHGRPRDHPAYAQRRKRADFRAAPEAVLAAIPGISTHTARSLLHHFGTVEAVVTADPEALKAVRGVGTARASALRTVLSASWRERQDAQDPST